MENKMRYFLTLLTLLCPSVGWAQSQVSLTSEVLVERVVEEPGGKRATRTEPPKVVTPGDKLLFILSYKNEGGEPAADFVVTNPIPDAVSYSGAEGESALVSIDGGKNWGALPSLKVTEADGTSRDAAPADVTHVRWTFGQAIPAGQSGKLRFRGVIK